jgi:two-component system, sensor histidine kinase and response regulator
MTQHRVADTPVRSWELVLPERATVLVVDDNEANRELARAALEDEGYVVVLAANGMEGIERFASTQPDCILLDVRMPDLDGMEVCARIRKMPRGADTPIVFLTALRDVETFDQALLAGADDFLTKPVRPTELALRVKAALELRQASAERGELHELLRKQRDDMLRAILEKERLTAFLVHDLKNPVTGMAMAADLIAHDAAATVRTREAAARIRAHADNLQQMIMNLLDLSKGDEGRLVAVRKPLDLASLVADVARAFDVRASARKVKVVTSLEVARIQADETLLRRVFENLLENAIRHAPPGTVVTISAIHDGSKAILRVTDAGAGVAPDLRVRIFDRYYRAAADERSNREGRGLGLAFCKVASEAHGGSIGVTDANPGSTFWVEIPDA